MIHTTRRLPSRDRRGRGRRPSGRLGSLAGQALVATLVLALVMRLLVSVLGLPGILNFVFFPVLLFGNLAVSARRNPTLARLTQAVMLVSLAVAATTLSNLASPMAAGLLWASLVTPFLLIRLAVAQDRPSDHIPTLDRLLVIFLFVQGGAIAFERFVLGQAGDAAQGFLRNQGAGHHVMGLVGMGTALYLAIRLWEEPGLRSRGYIYGAIATGMAMALITRTMQGILAGAVIGVSYLVTRRLRWPVTSAALVAGATIVVLFLTWPAFTPAGLNWHGPEFFANKGTTLRVISDEYREHPHQVLFGLGPGASATKAAWTGASEFDSLTQYLGVSPGEVATTLLDVERAKPSSRHSSLTSTWSTWLGVWGDLGVVGLLAYAWAWLKVIRLSLNGSASMRSGLHLGMFMALLGVFYNWLEEPVLTLFLGLALATAISASARPRLVESRTVESASLPT